MNYKNKELKVGSKVYVLFKESPSDPDEAITIVTGVIKEVNDCGDQNYYGIKVDVSKDSYFFTRFYYAFDVENGYSHVWNRHIDEKQDGIKKTINVVTYDPKNFKMLIKQQLTIMQTHLKNHCIELEKTHNKITSLQHILDTTK